MNKFYQKQVYIIDTWFVEYTCKNIDKAKKYLRLVREKYQFNSSRIIECKLIIKEGIK